VDPTLVPPDFWESVLVGFLAQMVDGALGMAYGLTATSFLLGFGYPPAVASAMTHSAEVFTTAASGVSHAWKRNVDWGLVLRLAPAGIIGGVLGALAVSHVPGEAVRPFVSLYLMTMGFYLMAKAIQGVKDSEPHLNGVIPLGVAGGFLDASGGGGWGPVVASTLLGRGHAPRMAIGSVNLSEFMVTLAISAAFFFALGEELDLRNVAGLVLGGVVAAPIAAHMVKIVPARWLMGFVALTVIALAAWQLRMLADIVVDDWLPAMQRWMAGGA
jgi:uncharacterized membrane protein YfcA